MIKIKHVSFSNIGRFTGKNEIDFENKGSFIQVDSENNNTGGSSGGGKSTIFNAIEYALGINDTPSTVLQSRLTKSPMSVTLVLDKNNQEYVISRDKSGSLEISGPDVEVTGSSKNAEEALDRILGMPRELLRPMLHKRQNEGGFFLSKTPKQSHEFLMECLGMHSIEGKIQKAEESTKKAEKALESTKSELQANEQTASAMVEMSKGVSEPTLNADPRILDLLLSKITSAKKKKDELESERNSKLAALKMPTLEPPKPDLKIEGEIKELETRLDLAQKSIMNIQNNKVFIESSIKAAKTNLQIAQKATQNKELLKTELLELGKKLKEVIDKKCPTCSQHLSELQTSEKIRADIMQKVSAKQQAMAESESVERKIPEYLNEIEKLESDLVGNAQQKMDADIALSSIKSNLGILQRLKETQQNDHNKHLNEIMAVYYKEKEQVEKMYDGEILELNSQIEANGTAYHRLQAEVQQYENALKRYKEEKEKRDKNISDLNSRISELKDRYLSLDKEHRIAKDSVELLKSYANQLFQDSLSVVAETATKILSRIPNMSTATLTFDAYKETKSGSVKEQVVPILSIDDEINIPIKSMSGGERAAIDLAVDMAVIDMIESNTGNGIDLFILDEPFDGLDAICRENCLEVLKNSASNRKILIVDHSTETKQMVQEKIIVVRDGQQSRVL
jgi:DNA repair exonuclease SbcCD ATPase subunit